MKYIKKFIIILIIFLTPSISFGAFAVGWNATSTSQGWILPNLINGVFQAIVGPYFIATSTATSSKFPFASSTAISTTNLINNAGISLNILTMNSNVPNSTNLVMTLGSGISGNVTGGGYQINSGNGLGSSRGGNFALQGGNGGATGDGGSFLLQAGSGGATSGNGADVQIAAGPATAGVSNGGNISFFPGAGTGGGTSGQIQIYDPTGSFFSYLFDSNGNFGIATNTPGTKLGVNGAGVFNDTVTAPIFYATSTTATSTFLGGITAKNINLTSSTATSTAANGFNLTGGCFSVRGSCITSGGGGGITTSSSTAQIWIDVNRVDSYTADGSIINPYKSINAAITGAPTAYGALAFHLAPGTYVENPGGGGNITFPNVPIVIHGNGATIVLGPGATSFGSVYTGTMTLPNDFDMQDVVLLGNLKVTDTSTTNPHSVINSFLEGNVYLRGNATILNSATADQPGASSTLMIAPGALTNILGTNVQTVVDVYGSGILNLNDDNVQTSTSTRYAITATSTGSIANMSGVSLQNFGTGGGINIDNGATVANASDISPIAITVGGGTVINAGTAKVYLQYEAFNLSGTRLYASGSNLDTFSTATINSEGNAFLNITGGKTVMGAVSSNFTDLGNATLMISTSTNNYAYVGLQNLGAGALSSSDIVFGNELTGTATLGYADCGMSSNIYLNPSYPFIDRNNFYCYNTVGPMSFVAATTSARAQYINFLVGGYASTTNEILRMTTGTTSITSKAIIGNSTANDPANAQLTVKNLSASTNIVNFESSATPGVSRFSITDAGILNLGGGFQINSNVVQTVSQSMTLQATGNSTGVILRGTTGSNGTVNIQSGNGASNSSDFIKFTVGPNGTTEAARILTNGSIGIGTTSPAALLSIQNQYGYATTTLFQIASTTSSTGATGNTIFRVDRNGQVFLPSLTQSGSAQTYYACGIANTFEIVWDTTACLVSAAKFKTDIKDISPEDALQAVLSMEPVTYKKKEPLNETDAGRQPGFIADSVKDPTLKETLVTYDDKGEIHGFRYEQFTAYLAGAIQKIWNIVSNHDERINKLEKENQELKSRLDALEKKIN